MIGLVLGHKVRGGLIHLRPLKPEPLKLLFGLYVVFGGKMEKEKGVNKTKYFFCSCVH